MVQVTDHRPESGQLVIALTFLVLTDDHIYAKRFDLVVIERKRQILVQGTIGSEQDQPVPVDTILYLYMSLLDSLA